MTLNFSDAPPFRDLGNITAMGVIAAFVYAIFFLPAFVAVMPCRKPAQREGTNVAFMDRFADFVVHRRKGLLVGSVLVSLVVLAFVPRNELNDEFVQYFKPSITFRQHTDFTTENLTGLYQVQYSLKRARRNGVSDPEFLKKLEAFSDWYRAQPHVMHVSTLADTFKRLNQNLHGDDPDWYRLPEQRDLAAQYLLLYEMSLPFGLDLNNQLNIDKSSTQFVASTESISTVELRDLVSRSEQWLRDNAPGMFSHGIGVSVMFSYISERNIKSMLGGTMLGLVLISGILLLALRSVKLGLLSLLPNLLPIGLTFGIWGMTVAQINVAASIVSGMILGIVVDDTVHFLSKYLRARREQGLASAAAVRYAFHTVGVALLVTTLVLVAGFMVLAQSNFVINGVMSILTAIGIALALIVDFLFLPPLLMAVDGDNEQRAIQQARSLTMNLFPQFRNAILALPFGAACRRNTPSRSSARRREAWRSHKEVDARDQGFGDTSSVLTMTLRNRHGEEVTRQMRSRALEVADDGDKSMIIFEDPADVKGTALLTFSHKTADDDQWLYLPALKRVKRISSSNKSGPFMGSEFAYEDLSSQEVEKYTYKYLRDETCRRHGTAL